MNTCLLTPAKILENLRVRATTLETSINAEPTSNFSHSLMIPLILLAVFIMFITLLTIFYCLHKKHKQQKKKQQGDFVSKGNLLFLCKRILDYKFSCRCILT